MADTLVSNQIISAGGSFTVSNFPMASRIKCILMITTGYAAVAGTTGVTLSILPRMGSTIATVDPDTVDEKVLSIPIDNVPTNTAISFTTKQYTDNVDLYFKNNDASNNCTLTVIMETD